MKLRIQPVTGERQAALADLFEDSPVCSRCWCMYWRIGAAYRKRPPADNRADFESIVRNGPPPGLLAFDGDTAVGWCQVTPRDALPALCRASQLQPVDDRPVWSISCFYVRKTHRKRGITATLIAAAIEAARRAGAPSLEAYPLDRDQSPSATSTGVLTTFLRAGFREVVRPTPPRPIVRYELE